MNQVFVSAGTPADQRQADFRDAIVNALELAGLSPRLMTDSDWDYKNPLRGLRRAMQGCCGAVVVAYARYKIESGLELRDDGNKPLTLASFPTAWNQIEAAIAYERQLPLLVVAENGIKPDAMFENSGDIRPFWCDLDPALINSEGFKGYLRSWQDDVNVFAAAEAEKTRRGTPRDLTLSQVFAALPWYETIGFSTTLLGLLFAAATFGYRWGTGEWPFG